MEWLRKLLGRGPAKRRDEVGPCERVAHLQELRRWCWKPVVQTGEGVVGEGGDGDSRFGGRPSLLPGEAWPACRTCGAAIPLFVQIDLARAPEPPHRHGHPPFPLVFRGGLLQLFYCTAEDCNCLDCGYFPTNTLARIAPEADLAVMKTRENEGPCFPARRIVGWQERLDLPDSAEAEEMDSRLPVEDLDEFYQDAERRGEEYPVKGDKWLGWPYWIQGVAYPDCPDCGREMVYLLQIDSEDNIPYMFGDCGVGHVCACPDHPGRVSFCWSCH